MQSGLKEGSHTCTLLHCVHMGICSNDCCGLCETVTRQFLQIVFTVEQNDQSCGTARHTCPVCKKYCNVQLVWHVLAFLVSVVFKN